jgi:mercuric reductase
MNDCCASSSLQVTASASATLPSYTVRPDVTFPDWSVVTSPLVKDALLAMNDVLRIMAGPNQPADRWSDRDRLVDRVRVALLKLYAEAG